jgi:tetratricopeptide (TPR) repeat protein
VALGRYAEASAALLPMVTHLSGDPARGFWILGVPALPAVFARSFFVDALVEQGCFDQAAFHAADALAIAEAVDDPKSLSPGAADTLVWGWSIMGFVPLARGLPRDAIGPFERVLDLCRAHDLPTYVLTAASALAEAQALDGNARNAVRLLSPLLEGARRGRKVYSLARNLVRLGEASLLAGVADDARAAAEEALDLARRRGMRGVEAYALRLKAETTERSRPFAPGEADRTYAEALEIADSLGMRPLVVHCHLGLGRLYRRTDKREQAHEHLTTATTMYREMGMTYWLEKAEVEMKGLA